MGKMKKKKTGTRTVSVRNMSESRPVFKDVRISLCMMVRDEEENLPRLLNSVKEMEFEKDILTVEFDLCRSHWM